MYMHNIQLKHKTVFPLQCGEQLYNLYNLISMSWRKVDKNTEHKKLVQRWINL